MAHSLSLVVSFLFVNVALLLEVQQVISDDTSFLQTKPHNFQKLDGSVRCEPFDEASPAASATTASACFDKCAEAADCGAFSYFSVPYTTAQCFLFDTCTETTALDVEVFSYKKQLDLDPNADDGIDPDASNMPPEFREEDQMPSEDIKFANGEDNEEMVTMEFEDPDDLGPLPAARPGEERRNTCEECLHSGMDYCIRANSCVPRGQNMCFGEEDHVTGDADFADKTGAIFLQCPEDSELLDGQYIMVHGHISEKVPTLFKEELTLVKGRNKCTQTPECHGITVEKMPSSDDEHVTIHFKSASDLVHSSWVSFILVERADAWTRAHYVPRADVIRGTGFLAPQMKSEEVPGESEEFSGDVHNLVGKTFASVAHNVSKDVFVTCFAPWCGWCQQFKPVLATFAKSLRHVKTLEFAQIDATRNDIDDFDITGYPTLLLFRAGSNKTEVLQYPGQRTPEAMRAWLHRYVTFDFPDYPPMAVQSAVTSGESGLLDDSEDL